MPWLIPPKTFPSSRLCHNPILTIAAGLACVKCIDFIETDHNLKGTTTNYNTVSSTRGDFGLQKSGLQKS
jgi:hypothetical protein